MATQNNPPGTSDEATISWQKSLYDPGYVNAMSHFYRGELGRIMVWRQRLDITTNWAITSSTAIITIAFANREVPHLIFFFNLAIVWVMLWIEARRYRFYDAFRARVRMLEAHFLVPMVMENRDLLQGEWKKLVCEDLILPSFKISRLEAVGHAPLVLLDCAHNVASAQALLDTLQASFPLQASGRRILIFASSRDKDVAGMLAVLAPHFAHVIVTRFADNPRAVPPEQLADTLAGTGHKDHTACATAIEAWDEARRRARPADQICITGSVFLAGELRATIRSSQTASVPMTS